MPLDILYCLAPSLRKGSFENGQAVVPKLQAQSVANRREANKDLQYLTCVVHVYGKYDFTKSVLWQMMFVVVSCMSVICRPVVRWRRAQRRWGTWTVTRPYRRARSARRCRPPAQSAAPSTASSVGRYGPTGTVLLNSTVKTHGSSTSTLQIEFGLESPRELQADADRQVCIYWSEFHAWHISAVAHIQSGVE